MPRYMIEVAGKQNESLAMPPPIGEKLRGRWDTSKTAHRDPGDAAKALARIHIIPGIYVSLDTDKLECKVADPLAVTPEGKRLWKDLEVIFKEFQELGGPFRVGEETVYKLDLDQVKTLAFAMRQSIDAGYAVPLPQSGVLPTQDEIRTWPGRRRRDPWSTGTQDNELEAWTDVVPVGGELVGAGAAGSGAGPSGQASGQSGGQQGKGK